jgi:phosphatidylinositol 4-kinase
VSANQSIDVSIFLIQKAAIDFIDEDSFVHLKQIRTKLFLTLVVTHIFSKHLFDPLLYFHRLVADVFGKDNKGKVPMDKVMMLIWKFRDDPSVVRFMAQFVTRYAGRRDVFDGIEFYLPQLAHMIIHLEALWDDAILESFALIIAQHSIHFALQLNWILQGAIEDYQPEMPNGEQNKHFNALYYTRCVRLLLNIERCVVYGTPRKHELQRLYEKGQITKLEYDTMEQADRRFNAEQLTNAQRQLLEAGTFGGNLLYKRLVRTSCCSQKNWKTRYFSVSERMLFCYNVHPSQGGRLIRAMPLDGAEIMETPSTDAKYEFMFEVHNLNYFFRMRAANEEERKRWIRVLEEERDSHNLYPYQIWSQGKSNHDEHSQFMKDLTPAQKARYDFFKNQRDFTRTLTNIAEELRFKDREVRKILAPKFVEDMNIPSCVYIPLCNSSDIWRRVHSPVSRETRVFNTNERCPVVVYFLTKRGEKMLHHRGGMKDVNLDVAEFLHLQYEIPESSMASINEEESTSFDEEMNNGNMKTVSSMLWKDEKPESQQYEHYNGDSPLKDTHSFDKGRRANDQLLNFVRDNLIRIPSKIKARLPHKQVSMLGQMPLHSVPILEHRNTEDEDENRSALSGANSGSILVDGGVLSKTENDGIDEESIRRATAFICRGENWAKKSERMLTESLKSKLIDTEATTEVSGVMIKSNDDLRQEVFVMQMIHFYQSVFAKASLPIWLKTYRILSTSKDTGMIEFLIDTTSIDSLKKSDMFPQSGNLRDYFEMIYGPPDSTSFKAAQRNFMLSLVGYSLVSYLLGLKDRHNGNIMIDVRGRLIFIDFGFAMGMAPGHEFSFERAPFKLTQDYIDVMGGTDSACFAEFKRLFVAGFEAARANSQIALGLVEIMMYKSKFPCFSGPRYGGDKALIKFQNRLMLRTPDEDVRKKALGLIEASMLHYGTWAYDRFQLYSNGYAM